MQRSVKSDAAILPNSHRPTRCHKTVSSRRPGGVNWALQLQQPSPGGELVVRYYCRAIAEMTRITDANSTIVRCADFLRK